MRTWSRPTARLLATSGSLIVLSSLASAASVVVVDAFGSPGSLPDIQAGIDAAPPGGIVLVKGGTYAGFDIVDKSVDVIADLNHHVEVASSRVLNLAPDRRVLLSGLKFIRSHEEPATRPSLELRDNEGTVFLQRLLVKAPAGDGAIHSAGLLVDGCDAVFATRCLLFGSEGSQGFVGSGPFALNEAVDTRSSQLVLYDTFALGGIGADGDFNLLLPDTFLIATRGGHGVLQRGGFLFVAGCSLGGGAGGDGDLSLVHLSCIPGASGGDGLRLTDGADAKTLDVALSGGPGGVTGGDLCQDGADGAPTVVENGTLTDLAGELPLLFLESPVREGSPFFLVLEGPPGASTLVLLSLERTNAFLAPLNGVLATGANAVFLPTGTLPALGQLLVTAPVPELGPGVDGVAITVQAIVAEPTGGAILTNPVIGVALDGGV